MQTAILLACCECEVETYIKERRQDAEGGVWTQAKEVTGEWRKLHDEERHSHTADEILA
jgi:hypothetical protein